MCIAEVVPLITSIAAFGLPRHPNPPSHPQKVTIATKNQPFSQGGWKGVAELVVGFERKLGCLFLSIVPTRLPIFHEGFRDTLARSSARFHGCRS